MTIRQRILARLGLVPMTSEQLAYLSRAMFRQRMDKPDDSPALAASLDPHISIWRHRLRKVGCVVSERDYNKGATLFRALMWLIIALVGLAGYVAANLMAFGVWWP
jgi:hypothetical protein